jgi:hypothetical protein
VGSHCRLRALSRFSAAGQTRISGPWHWTRRVASRMVRCGGYARPVSAGYLDSHERLPERSRISRSDSETVDVFLRDLATGRRGFSPMDPPGRKGIQRSPPKRNLLAVRPEDAGRRARSPADLRHRSYPTRPGRTLGEDCGGRPREWVDERTAHHRTFRAPELDCAPRYGTRRPA